MAVEPRRGCGYRKIGGLYLVSGPGGMPCDRLPFPLTICPTCNQGIKQTRGWTWVTPNTLFGGMHSDCMDGWHTCPVCQPTPDRAGLLWIGEKFYPTPTEFHMEAADLGISRRIKAIPRGFEIRKTWILLAHPKAIREFKESEYEAGIIKVWRPTRIEKILPESKRGSEEAAELDKKGITCVYVPDNDPDHTGSVYESEEQMELVP